MSKHLNIFNPQMTLMKVCCLEKFDDKVNGFAIVSKNVRSQS